jgi:hypothetical protein
MKPLISVAMIALLSCAWRSASAQGFGDEISDASVHAYRWPAPTKPWEMNPPLAILPHGDLWQDYTGGGKHGRYAARAHVHICKPTPARNILAALCGWFDKLIAGPCRPANPAPCIAGLPAPSELPFPEQEHPRAPLALPRSAPAPEPSVLGQADPVEEVSPHPAPRSQPSVAADPMPVSPLDSEETKSARPGVVELAPDFVFPKERATPAVPRNRIPARGDLPRNSIPAQ